MSRGMGPSWQQAAQPGTNEPDDIAYDRERCRCGAFLPWQPTQIGDGFMAWTCKRCTSTLVREYPPTWTVEGDPF